MSKNFDFYISKGFDKQFAEYFAAGRKRLTDVIPNENFTLILTYDNNDKRLFDMKPIIQKGGVFTHFKELDNFNRVYIDDCNNIAWDIDPNIDSNIIWNNKVDLSSDSCYIDSIPYK